ncbi:MAG: putative 2-aminoethylphosphonate ABC transporter permease subunit, partial [Alphaproteobacteria bacterium]
MASATGTGGDRSRLSQAFVRLRKRGREGWIMLVSILALCCALIATLVLPLYALLSKSVQDDKG